MVKLMQQDDQAQEVKQDDIEDDLQPQPKKRRRGVYLIPNLFTTFGLFAGFFAIISAVSTDSTGISKYVIAAIAILVAMLLDGIDGRIARMTNTQTDFGAEYDSLADMVSFGIAPALVMYEWSLKVNAATSPEMYKIGWLAAFFYVAMAALRLARFNVQTDTIDKRYFRGLPSPAAAGLMVSYIWICEVFKLSGAAMWVYSLLITVIAGALMISPIMFNSFKDSNREGKIPFRGLVLIVVLIPLVYYKPSWVLFVVFFAYAMSGPLMSIIRRVRKRRKFKQEN